MSPLLFDIILFIIIFFIILLINYGICYNSKKIENMNNLSNSKMKIWTYWENLPNKNKPPYINLCYKTLEKHCKDCDIIKLDNNNIYSYLPNLRKDINSLILAHKTDYIRVALLYKYGGCWIDADTIIMNSLDPIKNKLNEGYDYIGFGCSNIICKNGYPFPSNMVMASQKGSILMKKTLIDLDNILDDYYSLNKKKYFDYFDLGKNLLWKNIKLLKKSQNYNYYHFSAEVDGTRDSNFKWVNVKNHLSTTPTKLINENKLLFIFLENNKLCGDNSKYNWFCKLSEEDILKGKYWISTMFKKSLYGIN